MISLKITWPVLFYFTACLSTFFLSCLQTLLKMHHYILHLAVQGKGRNKRMNLPYEVTQQLLF